MRWSLISVLLIWISFGNASAQIYYDELYGGSETIELISVNGTVAMGDRFLSWSDRLTDGHGDPFFLVTDSFGELVDSITLFHSDTVSFRVGSVMTINDSQAVAISTAIHINQSDEVNKDCYLIKFDVQGNICWERYIGNSNSRLYAGAFCKISDGGYMITGQIVDALTSNEQGDVYAVRTDSDGQIIWLREYGGNDWESGKSVVETPDGGFLILGWTRSFGSGQRDFYLIKIDNQGNEQWHETYGGGSDEGGASVIPTFDGSYLLTGSGSNPSVSGSTGRLYKISAFGDELWSETYTNTGNTSNNFHKSVELPSRAIVSVGATGAGGSAGWLVKTDSAGLVEWQREYDKNDYTDLFYSLLRTDDGGFLLSGMAWNEQTSNQDAWLLKVDSIGCPYPNCTVGIDEQERTVMVDVWPNPCTDVLNIEVADRSATIEMTVMDMAGRTISPPWEGSGVGSLDVSAWHSGIYILQGTDEKGRSFSVKVIKQ